MDGGGNDRAGIRSRIRRLRRSLCGRSWHENEGGRDRRSGLQLVPRNQSAGSLSEAVAAEGHITVRGPVVERGSQSLRLTTTTNWRGNGREGLNSSASTATAARRGRDQNNNNQATLMQCLLREMENEIIITTKSHVEEEELELELEEEGGGRNNLVCCVCMGRKKGAALIPCGHTYCRACAHQLWLRRGTCPLCNRPIADILTIYS